MRWPYCVTGWSATLWAIVANLTVDVVAQLENFSYRPLLQSAIADFFTKTR